MIRPRLTTALLLAASALAAPLSHAAPADTNRTAAWFAAHQERTPLLRQFLQRMPKGADLHSHISGAVYAESYLKWAAEANYCVDTEKLAFTTPNCTESGTQMPAGKLPGATAAALVDHMSMRNLAAAGRSGHDQFFDTFGVFGPISGLPDRFVLMMTELTERAASQHIQHLELMTTLQSPAVRQLTSTLPWAAETDFAKRRQWLLEHGLLDLVTAGRKDLDELDQAYARHQGCGTPAARPGCAVSVRWLQQTTRTAAPELVFAQLAYAFEIAKADQRVVGLNLVAPEDHPVALRDYRLQMEMIGFLARQSPGVKIALHAGELVLGMVPPENLRSHIHDAVLVAGAHRIGHAVDIGHEDGAQALLKTMQAKGVAAEICLTSNDVILGVKGKDHPLPDYLAAGVPVVLASDDEGVSRIDLSNEYLRAAQSYGLGYRPLKQLSRNSLEYSFLPGPSLWQNAAQASLNPACRKDVPGAAKLSAACQAFLNTSERASRQWALEAAFDRFEKLPEWAQKKP
ncbi:MAG: adenosine deaminase [Leptothrix sp. (in: b-proteobacteria)]